MTAQHGARTALALGLAASLAGNVIAAHPSALGRLVAAWPPLALLVAVELVTRIPTRGGPLSAVRLASAGMLAVIAAWVSYWHLVELARLAGEGGIAAHLLPLSVDGLVAVASVCLRELSPPTTRQPTPRPMRTTTPAPAQAIPTLASERPPVPTPPPMPQRRSGDEVRRLAAEHTEWSRDQLAAAAGCSARTVRRHLAAAGAPERSLDDELADLVAPAPSPVPDDSPVTSLQETTS